LAAPFLISGPGPALAHDVLVWASFQDKAIKAGTATTVTLRFNAAIEASLSQVSLIDGDGHEQALESRAGSRQGELVVDVPALPAGAYGLRYKVLASDGHLTDELVRFRINTAD